MNRPYKIYLASHFFNRSGYMETDQLADIIREYFTEDEVELYVPQRNDGINDKGGEAKLVTDEDIAIADMIELANADMVIANCDGVEIDSGVAGEIMGAAMCNLVLNMSIQGEHIKISNKTIIGYTTDMRINPIGEDFVEIIKELVENDDTQGVIDLIENEKANNLYRNRMITGLVKLFGKMIVGQANNDNYIYEIIKEINKKVKKYDSI